MRRILALIILVVLLATPAAAWNHRTVASATGTLWIPLFNTTTLEAGGGLATDVQVKNTGSGVVTFSLWRFDGVNAFPNHPLPAKNVGDPFYAVSDSVITLNPTETFKLEDASNNARVSWIFANRTAATSLSVTWK